MADSSLEKSIGRASVDVMTCTVGDTQSQVYILQEHIGQLLHQMLFLAFNYCIYVSVTEVGIIYISVVCYPHPILLFAKKH